MTATENFMKENKWVFGHFGRFGFCLLFPKKIRFYFRQFPVCEYRISRCCSTLIFGRGIDALDNFQYLWKYLKKIFRIKLLFAVIYHWTHNLKPKVLWKNLFFFIKISNSSERTLYFPMQKKIHTHQNTMLYSYKKSLKKKQHILPFVIYIHINGIKIRLG